MAQQSGSDEMVDILQFIRNWNSVLDHSEYAKTDNVSLEDYLKVRMDVDDAMVSELDTVCG